MVVGSEDVGDGAKDGALAVSPWADEDGQILFVDVAGDRPTKESFEELGEFGGAGHGRIDTDIIDYLLPETIIGRWVVAAIDALGEEILRAAIDDDAVLNGYEAPFPDGSYLAGARKFPSLVPLLPHHKAEREKNDAAWKVLAQFDRPVLTAFSDDDPVTRGGDKRFQEIIPGAKGVAHVTIKGGGHFLQELQPEAFSAAIVDFMKSTS